MSIPSSGSSTARSASTTCSLVGTKLSLAEEAHFLAPLAREEMDAVDEPHPVAASAHDQGMRPCRVGEEAHATQEVTVRHARGGDDYLTRRQVVGREDLLDVVEAVLSRLLDLASRHRPQLRLHLAAEAAERSGGHHGLPGAADADRKVVVRAADHRRDRRGHVSVLDQLDPGAGGADLLDQVVMPWTVEHDRRYVVDAAAERLGDAEDVVGHRFAEIDRRPCQRTDRELAHVHIRQGLQGARLTDRDHRHRSAAAAGDHSTPFQRVERQVDLLAAGSNPLARGETLRLVAAGPDHDSAVDRQLLERRAHRLGRVTLRALLVGPAEPTRPGECGALRRAGVALAEAIPVDRRLFAGSDRSGFGHPTFSKRSADSSTSSIAWAIASSMLPFSITGTPAFSARETM